MEYILGIDLGTTNSCTYYKSSYGDYKVLQIENSNLLPSIVSFRDDIILVGKQAENRRVLEPMDTVYAFKRLLGRVWESSFLQATLKYYTYDIVKHENSIRININGKLYAVEEFSAFVLEKIKEVASRKFNTDITKVVITVPAFFNENQRRSVKDAGVIAGLDVLRIINEPTAAALAYGYQKGANQKILVYDLGGGTFDVTILDITGEVFEVVATIGDTFLGGEDFTNKIVEWIALDIQKNYKSNFSLKNELIVYQRIREVSEMAKKELSIREETEINLPFLFVNDNKENVNYSTTLTRKVFNELVEPIVNKTIKLIDRILKHIEMDIDEIDNVLLVGGQTRSLIVKSKLESFLGRSVSKNVNPDEVVALGAAIHGNLLTEDNNESLLLDVISQSMGIMISGGYYEKIIEKDSVIPCSSEKEFTTIKDNQEKVEIHIFQGEEAKVKDNTYLGHLHIDNIPPMSQGEFKVNIRFIVNSEGILTVEATDLFSNKTYNLVLKGTSSLSDSELSQIKSTNSISSTDEDFLPLMNQVKSLLEALNSKYSDNKSILIKFNEYNHFIADLEAMSNITVEEKDHFKKTLMKILDGLQRL